MEMRSRDPAQAAIYKRKLKNGQSIYLQLLLITWKAVSQIAIRQI